jgi:hypothetical protein
VSSPLVSRRSAPICLGPTAGRPPQQRQQQPRRRWQQLGERAAQLRLCDWRGAHHNSSLPRCVLLAGVVASQIATSSPRWRHQKGQQQVAAVERLRGGQLPRPLAGNSAPAAVAANCWPAARCGRARSSSSSSAVGRSGRSAPKVLLALAPNSLDDCWAAPGSQRFLLGGGSGLTFWRAAAAALLLIGAVVAAGDAGRERAENAYTLKLLLLCETSRFVANRS